MKIGILSRRISLYSTIQLARVGRDRGHEVKIIDPLDCYMSIGSKDPSVHFRDERLCGFDAMIPRVGASVTFFGVSVVRQFEAMGIFCVNGSEAIIRSRDKLCCLQILGMHGIPIPLTGFAYSSRYTDDLIDLVGSSPLLVKIIEGTQGIGVVLADTRQTSQSVIDAFRELKARIIIQEYIKESNGSDLRCLVVGDTVVAGMLRKSKLGEFRSNIHRGGHGERVNITEEEKSLALKACRVMGLNVAGVDILRGKNSPLVIEVNSSPGLQNIEEVTGIDIASEIIAYIERVLS